MTSGSRSRSRAIGQRRNASRADSAAPPKKKGAKAPTQIDFLKHEEPAPTSPPRTIPGSWASTRTSQTSATTGQIRSSTDEIACWFLDTDYNGESFFVRHAYFTGAGDPYEKLKRALRAEIDENVWATLYRTKSRPFERPGSGKIAVKVINHYGDEVLKVYAVESGAAK